MEALLTQSVARHRLTHDQLLAPFHDAMKPARAFRVGTEAEKFGLHADSFAPLPYEGPRSVSAVLAELHARFGWKPEREYEGGAIIALTRGEASITLEPGGQLELSGAPFASIHDTHAEWVEHVDEINAIGEALGITWLGLGFHPFATQAQLPWVPKLRYAIMREYLPLRGSMGLDMMRRTCTVQSNLDYASEDDAMRKLRVALALSPIITAMFANSPLYEGAVRGERTHRGLVWLNMDPDRTGLLPFLWSAEASFERYVAWALDVPMFLIKRGGKILRNTGQTFRAFMRDGFEGESASEADWMLHLGTLFPEVRLKKTIEVRGADSLPYDLVPALPALTKGLFYDPETLQKAEKLAEKLSFEVVEQARADIVARGLAADFAGRPALAWAEEVVSLAHEGLVRLDAQAPDPRGSEAVYLAPLEQLLARGQTPADALLEKLDTAQPLGPQVLKHARLGAPAR
jgi:glutamate--cysteine ligase